MSYETKVRLVLDIPCSYFRRNRPFQKKILFWQVANLNDDPNLIQAIDDALGIEQEEKPTENTSNVDQSIIDQWQRIKRNPKTMSLYCLYFKRGFRTPEAQGKEIYAYTFFDLTDMVRKVGRSNMLEGYFLEPPISLYRPPSRDEWVRAHLESIREAGRIRGPSDLQAYTRTIAKQYKRAVQKRTYVFLLLIPTWTRQGLSRSMQQTKDFQNVAQVVHHAEAELGPTIAQTHYLKEAYTSEQKVNKNLRDELRKSFVIVANLSSELEANDRKMKQIQQPTKPIVVGNPQIPFTPSVPVTGRIGRMFATVDWTSILLVCALLFGIALLGLGVEQYMLDPARSGLMYIGAFWTIVVIVLMIVFRRRQKVPSAEAVRETVGGVAEALGEE